MEKLLQEAEQGYHSPQRGQIVTGVVMRSDRDGILVNIGGKTEGVVPAREMFSLGADFQNILKNGDEILVCVLRPENESGQALLSVDKARGEIGWRKLEECLAKATAIEGIVVTHNKGGLVVSVEGVQGFIPLSQVGSIGRTNPGQDPSAALAALAGKKLMVKVLELDRKRNRAILSERAALQEVRAAQKQKLLAEIKEGELRHGKVTGTAQFGAFVDLGGADGLIHISELSWEPVRSVEEVVKVGDDVEVYVSKIDTQNQRIGLSLKRVKPEPWTTIGDKYQVGQLVTGTVTKLAAFGAFVRLEGSIEGLVHISELANKPVNHPRDIVKEGDTLTLKVVKIDTERRRIGLSLKQVEETQSETFTYVQQAGTENQMSNALKAAMDKVAVGETGPEATPS